ncbi:NAD(+) diphosphatase [Promicromonospora soli]|uniref:NAD(+) diphosphatase n=1 Tax=Promicromonospora soli TaxID=2035533 RepID=A0A919KTU8_9MICO|nr:NAD(+) diphosphatase [Promicromonospora soli]GHH72955.1 NTP pyrophosphohydrolase [Promicromonospora soli]
MRFLDLPFARAAHDRAAHRRAEPRLVDDLLKEKDTRVLVLRGSSVAVVGERVALFAPDDVAHLAVRTHFFLGEADGVAYLSAVLPEPAPDDQPEREPDLDVGWTGMRTLDMPDLEQGLAVEAIALAQWHAVHTHCPRCGAETEVTQGGWVRHCPVDDSNHFPRTDPAVIMAITDAEDRLLLARGPQWGPGRRSVLAGFVEPGEGLEQAVARETLEEVGVVVDPESIEYRGSQSWPFPASLMLGFRARATTTRLVRQEDEIAEADWFTRDEVATAVADGDLGMPGRASIARSLIEEWFGGRIED